MPHLSDEQLLALARNDGDSVLHNHALECAKCSQRMQMWRLAVERLPAVLQESVSESEIHHLQSMFRHHGPEQTSVVRWLASLVRSSADVVGASVRGSSTADLFEYEAGPFSIMLESGPLQGGTYSVHGQLFHSDHATMAGAKVVIDSDDGAAFVESLDEFGEFHVEVTRPGLYHATVWTCDGLISVADLNVGGSSGD